MKLYLHNLLHSVQVIFKLLLQKGLFGFVKTFFSIFCADVPLCKMIS